MSLCNLVSKGDPPIIVQLIITELVISLRTLQAVYSN